MPMPTNSGGGHNAAVCECAALRCRAHEECVDVGPSHPEAPVSVVHQCSFSEPASHRGLGGETNRASSRVLLHRPLAADRCKMDEGQRGGRSNSCSFGGRRRGLRSPASGFSFPLVLVAALALGVHSSANAQKTAQQIMEKEAHDAEHSDAMAAVDAGLGGDESRNGLLAGLAATSERLRALEAEGADVHLFKMHQKQAATSSEVLAELKDEARQELNRDPYPTHVANSASWPHQVNAARVIATRGRASSENDFEWGYGEHDGPSTWGERFQRCKDGSEQSPIDIVTDGKSTRPEDILDIAILRWALDSGEQTAKAASQNGRAAAQHAADALGDKEEQGLFLTLPVNSRFQEVQARSDGDGDGDGDGDAGRRRLLAATEVYTGHALEVEGLGAARLAVEGTWYGLREVLLHTPSEHEIDGRHADLEMQLVHVVEHGQGGYGYLVVSVLFSVQSGDPSPRFLSQIVAAVPSVRESRRVRVDGVAVHEMTQALQDPLRSYYRYQGSLTTPPCLEGVQWFVAAQELPVSKSDVEVITALQGQNNRPTQPLNGRVIRYVP